MKKPEPIDSYFAEPDVHAETRVGAAGPVAFIAALLFTIGHGFNAWLLVTDHIGFALALFIHVILAVVAAVLARAFASSARESRFFLLLFIATATMGVFGAAGVMVTVLLHQWYMRFAQPFSLWFASIFPSTHHSESQNLYDDIQIGRDESSKPYSVIPFVDVIWYGNEAQKRIALAKMTSRFDPSFAPAFRKALNDSSNTIRVQAATAISKIENHFAEKLMRLTRLLEHHPKEPDIILALASHCDDFAFTGILDADRERTNREQALIYYMQYLELKPSSTEVHMRVGRLLMRSVDTERAADWLKLSLQRGHRSMSLLMWYAEALYNSHRYSELRQFARETRLQSGSDAPPAWLADSLMFWENQGGRA